MSKPDLFVVSSDYEKLQTFLRKQPDSEAVDLLREELDRANIVDDDEMPLNVVRMHSKVSFTILSTNQRCTYVLVFPHELRDTEDALSILSPVGSALLGLTVGDEIDWPLPGGKQTRIRIDELIHTAELAETSASA